MHSTRITDTPEFLIWALEHACPIRGFQTGSDPERAERQLRAARAASDAQREGRVFEGLCVNPPSGFRIDKALALYGGAAAVEQACTKCPANAGLRVAGGNLAGCYGLFPLPDKHAIQVAVEAVMDRDCLAADYDRLFAQSRPRWYGLWLHSPLNSDQLAFLVSLFAALDIAESARAGFEALKKGLQTAIDAQLSFHVVLYPRGRVEGTSWRLTSHCPRCKAAWAVENLEACGVCGLLGHPAPEKKRKARGNRPYRPLAALLGEPAAREFLVRYEHFRAQSESQGRAQIPPRAAPPDNLLVG